MQRLLLDNFLIQFWLEKIILISSVRLH